MREKKKIESKWQNYWRDHKTFSIDLQKMNIPYYILTMFPYPSGDKLHMGHWYQYGLMDSWARFKRLNGKEVFQPMGFDSFGLPAENNAIRKGIHPKKSTKENIDTMIRQFSDMGVSYDWNYYLETSDPNYYKWTQWLFIQLYNKGLAYKKKAPVNWCPSCQTVLANEQVLSGKCERCNSDVIQKELKQWFFKITEYADKLLNNIEDLNWPQKTKSMQKNWIGKSSGAKIKFKVENNDIHVFTTRPDTIYGATFLILAPEHPLVSAITTEQKQNEVNNYIFRTSKMSELDRISSKEKTGAFTGAYAVNPVNSKRIPIWIADYVLPSYGSGAIMAVPAHDERDNGFAKKYNLPIVEVISENGNIVNSEEFNGNTIEDMQELILIKLESEDLGARKVEYRLRDWLVSRQRYWGSPIPIINCSRCGEVPVPLDQLPVKLPDNVEFNRNGESPLITSKEFTDTICPKCGGNGTREVDTLDTFVCSSWYFLRFPDNNNTNNAFDSERINNTLPVDRYCGGAEHSCMHLLYARFINHFLFSEGLVNFEEPFPNLTHQGMILGPDGHKMSKSKGNSISPDPYVEEYGSDVLRMYLAFGFNYSEGGPWNDGGVRAISKFMDRLNLLFTSNAHLFGIDSELPENLCKLDKDILFRYHSTIKDVTSDTEKFMFNTSIARMMELYNDLSKYISNKDFNKNITHEILTGFIVMLSPYAPHMAEEWWSLSKNESSVFSQRWPIWEKKYLEKSEYTFVIMINGKKRGEIMLSEDLSEEDIVAESLRYEKTKHHFVDKKIVRRIIVPRKLINFIVT